jgi:hypothetical protein
MTNQPVEPQTSSADVDQSAQSSGKPGKPGRPSLGGSEKEGNASPQIAFRVNPTLRQRAQQVAESEGINVSQLSRKALKEYLTKK